MTEESREYQQLRRDQNRREAAAASKISPFPSDDDYESRESLQQIRMRRLDAQEWHETGGSVFD